MSNVNGGTITVRVAGQDVGLTDLLARLNTQMNSSMGTIRNYNTTLQALDPTTKALQAEQVRFAQSMASVAAKSGDTAGAIRILGTTLQGVNTQTVAAQQGMSQLQGLLNAQDAAAKKASFSFAGLAQGIQTLVGGYLIASRVIREFAQIVGEGNELEKTLTTFRVLSGSAEQYEKNLALAREQQNKFGGSLNDTVEGMSSFANLSARTGIEITKLTNTARALAIIDPAQGFKGAGIALKEFFSGEITSLARRFEIPREALSGVEKITDNVQKFEELQRVLAQFGISQELVTAQASTTAVTYEKLGGALADARAAMGSALAAALEKPAQGFTIVLNNVATGLNTLVSRTEQLQGFSGKIFAQTSSGGIDAFNAKVQELNKTANASENAWAAWLAQISQLTPAEYAFVAALTARGVAANEAFAALEKNREAMDAISAAGEHAAEVFPASTAAIKELSIGLGEVASTGTEGAAVALGLANAVAAGLPVEQAAIYLAQYKANVIRQVADAQANLATQQTVTTAALDEEIIKVLSDNQAKTENKIITEGLFSVLQALTNGTITQGQAESILQGQYNATSSQLPGLINLTYELAAARDAARVAGNALNQAETNAQVNRNRDIGRQGRGDSSDAAENSTALVKSLQAAAKAESEAILRNGTATQKRAEYNKRLADSVKLYGSNSAAAIKAQSDIDSFDAAQEKAGKKGGGAGGAPKLTANEKLNTALQDQQDKFNDKFEDAEQKHWDKVADIYTEFNEKQQQQFAKNEVSKRRSRADFYAGLQDAPAGVDTQKFAAQYEEAFSRAQEIAQTGKAKLASEFLDLRTQQIAEMQKLDEDAAKIQEDQKEGKISKGDAENQLAYLEGRRKLIEDAQKEEQDQLLAAGDANLNQLQEQLDKEAQAYATQTDKIGTAAERAADAKITHAERSKIAVSAENKVLAEQQGIYDDIARKNGGVVPKSGTVAPAATGSIDPNTKPTVDVTATEPLPISTAEAMLVAQNDIFLVRDTDTVNAIADMATRLEAGLGTIAAAVNDAKSAISSAVNAVEGAIGRIKLSAPSVVGNN